MATITIDGRGTTVTEAIRDMWKRIRPLEEKGYHPVSDVEIVDTSSKKIVRSFQLTDPEFQLHLKSDAHEESPQSGGRKEHRPPTAHEYPYMARVRLED